MCNFNFYEPSMSIVTSVKDGLYEVQNRKAQMKTMSTINNLSILKHCKLFVYSELKLQYVNVPTPRYIILNKGSLFCDIRSLSLFCTELKNKRINLLDCSRHF